MKFYLASRLSNQKELLHYRNEIIKRGHIVISRWLDIDRSKYPLDFKGSQLWQEFSKIRYLEDLTDIDNSDAIVLYPNEDINKRKPNGGMYVEFGYALGTGKLLHVIEPTNYNIFLYYGLNLLRHKSWEIFLQYIVKL